MRFGARERGRLASVQERLPLEEILGDVVRLRGGEIRGALLAGSVGFALRSEGEQEAILAGYRRFLNGLSYPIQVLVRVAETDVDVYLAGLGAHRAGLGRHDGGADTALGRLARDHEAFVRRLASERTLLERRCYLVVGGEQPGLPGGGFIWPWQQAVRRERRLDDLRVARRRLAFRCDQLQQGLAAFGVATRRLGGRELVSLWQAALGTDLASGEPGRGDLGPVAVTAGAGSRRRRSGEEMAAGEEITGDGEIAAGEEVTGDGRTADG